VDLDGTEVEGADGLLDLAGVADHDDGQAVGPDGVPLPVRLY
jgi:hypothetical protein